MTTAEIAAAITNAGLEPLPSGAIERFQQYLDLLLKWNARLNLTAIREPQEIVERHFIECIFAAQQLPSEIQALLDFGSGAGFPGLPIAICRPEIRITLGESQAKKAAFLREATRVLSVQNTSVFHGRVETLNRKFDAVVLRAVDKMQEACQMALRNLAAGGYLVIFATEETWQLLTSGFDQIDWAAPIPLPGSVQRQLLIGRYRADVPRGTNS